MTLQFVVLSILEVVRAIRQQVVYEEAQVVDVVRLIWRDDVAQSEYAGLQVIDEDVAVVDALVDYFVFLKIF